MKMQPIIGDLGDRIAGPPACSAASSARWSSYWRVRLWNSHAVPLDGVSAIRKRHHFTGITDGAGDLEDDREARVRGAFAMAEDDDFGAHALARDVQDSDSAEPGGEVVGKDRAAGVDEQHVIAKLQSFHVRITADDDVDELSIE